MSDYDLERDHPQTIKGEPDARPPEMETAEESAASLRSDNTPPSQSTLEKEEEVAERLGDFA